MKHIGAIKHFSTAISIFCITIVFIIATVSAASAQRDVTTLAQRDTIHPAVQQTAAAQQTTTPQQPTTLQKVLQSPYMPQFHGLLNARYEYEPRGGEKGESASSSSKPETEGISRFEIRHARVDMTGRVSPIFDYRIQVDFSDEGSIKPIDAYIHFTPFKGFELTAGQMRIPSTLDAHRSPATQFFANRSFIAKYGGLRDVGVMLGYTFSNTPFPIILQAGIYNGASFTEQKNWHVSLLHTFKAQFLVSKQWVFTCGIQDRKPDSVRFYMVDAGGYYQGERLHVETEYLYYHYAHNAFHDVNAVNAFANYDLPIKFCRLALLGGSSSNSGSANSDASKYLFKKISFLVRYDYMQDHSNGKVLATHSGTTATGTVGTQTLAITNYHRSRATYGITLSMGKPFTADLRLNYEDYFYRKNAVIPKGEQDKFVIELMLKF
ncbi:MAG: OprO/OprP family phosphate-selective porin [Bacteroidales bacterium]|jgi:hypothetical protein|nr:OprO/OprP family phosphate-selective porin [Bacteroidales bacterium]MCI1733738.1 OprO/OprP family phosphate-selective porin [Bacteroidales bacterium]